MKKILPVVFSVVSLNGCAAAWGGSVSNDAPREISRTQLYDAQKIVNYFNRLNPRPRYGAAEAPQPMMKAAPAPEKITIEQAVAKYVPKDYRVSAEADVNMKTSIVFDGSRPWMEALGKSLADADFELAMNLAKQTVNIKPQRFTLSEILEKYVPNEYKVFTDSNVDLDAFIKYDKSSSWIEALSKPLKESGVEMTVNLDKKVVYLRQVHITEAASNQVKKQPSTIK